MWPNFNFSFFEFTISWIDFSLALTAITICFKKIYFSSQFAAQYLVYIIMRGRVNVSLFFFIYLCDVFSEILQPHTQSFGKLLDSKNYSKIFDIILVFGTSMGSNQTNGFVSFAKGIPFTVLNLGHFKIICKWSLKYLSSIYVYFDIFFWA